MTTSGCVSKIQVHKELNVLKAECSDRDWFSVAAIRWRCAHGSACCLRVSASAVQYICADGRRGITTAAAGAGSTCFWVFAVRILGSQILADGRRGSGAATRAAIQSSPYTTRWSTVAAIRRRCAHCSACVVSRLQGLVFADLCGWQKRQHSSSSGGDFKFAARNKLEVTFGTRFTVLLAACIAERVSASVGSSSSRSRDSKFAECVTTTK